MQVNESPQAVQHRSDGKAQQEALTIAAAARDALRAAQVEVDGVRLRLHQPRRAQQRLWVVCAELHQQRPAHPSLHLTQSLPQGHAWDEPAELLAPLCNEVCNCSACKGSPVALAGGEVLLSVVGVLQEQAAVQHGCVGRCRAVPSA